QELRVARPNCAPIVPTRSSGLRATCGRALVECRMLAARSEPSRLRTDSQRSKMSCVLRPVNLLLCSMFPAEARWRTGTVLGAPKRVQADFSSQGGWGARTDARSRSFTLRWRGDSAHVRADEPPGRPA